jgi:hypothetical protein
MAGYSGTPLPKKLGIKEKHRVALVNVPADFAATLGDLPAGTEVVKQLRAPLDVIVFFTQSESELWKRFGELAAKLAPAGGLWIGWPKKASGVPTDLTENVVRQIGLEVGLVDNKICAIDETWSGLRFVIRLKDRQPSK